MFCLFQREQFGISISKFGIQITTVAMSDFNAENEVIANVGCYGEERSYLQGWFFFNGSFKFLD